MLKTLKLPSAEEFEASLDEAQKWALSVGYDENDDRSGGGTVSFHEEEPRGPRAPTAPSGRVRREGAHRGREGRTDAGRQTLPRNATGDTTSLRSRPRSPSTQAGGCAAPGDRANPASGRPRLPQRKTQTHTDNHRRATDRPSSTATPTTPRPQGTDHHLGARTPSTANLDQSRCGRAHPRAPRGRGGFPRGTGPRKTGEAAVREAPTRGQDRGARARAGTAEREEAASADARGRPGSRDAGRARHTDNRPHV